MQTLSPSLSGIPAVLTVELPLDAVTAGQRPPEPLSPDQAEQLAWAIADDLRRILGDLDQYGLVVLGALYDLTEVLRPGLPMVETLMELYRGSLHGGEFTPQLLALGGQGPRFPIPAIAPRRQPGSGPLLAIPFLLLGSAEALDSLEHRMEESLLEKGRAGVKTDQVIRSEFGLGPENLAYATFNDLCALLKLQLEHAGFSELWELLEGALFRPNDGERVKLDGGNLFLRQQGTIYTPYYTPGQWLAEPGHDLKGYSLWLQRQRQYQAGLQAHGLEVELVRPDPELEQHCANGATDRVQRLPVEEGLYFAEPVQPRDDLRAAAFLALTEHSAGALGPVAYTVFAQDEAGQVVYLAHEYPLAPAGVAAIRQRWEQTAGELGVDFHLLQPGRVVLDEDGRRLMPLLEDDAE